MRAYLLQNAASVSSCKIASAVLRFFFFLIRRQDDWSLMLERAADDEALLMGAGQKALSR